MNDSKEEIKPFFDESTNVGNPETPPVALNVDLELPTPIKKKRKERELESGEKIMVINIYKYRLTHQPDMEYEDLMKSMSKQTGIKLRTVEKTVDEYRRSRNLKSLRKKQTHPTVNYTIDDYGKNAIRRKIQAYWFRREKPTFQKCLPAIMNDSDFPNISEESLKSALKELSYKYFNEDNQNCALIERNELVLWRYEYIDKVRRYRDEGLTIYYLDEMCVKVNVDDCCTICTSNIGIDTKVKSQSNSLLNPSSEGLENPTTKGYFMIVVHIGSTEGFVEGGLLCLKSENGVMNDETFYKWFCGVLPRLNDNCIIVMDNASYHSAKKERIPTKHWTKDNIVKWLLSKNCDIGKTTVKCQLLESVKKIRPLYDKYLIDEEALKTNKIVLRLPPYHNELSPFELVWHVVKNDVKINFTRHAWTDVQVLISCAARCVTPDLWTKCVNQTIKEEDKLYELGLIIDDMLEVDDVKTDTPDSSD